LLETALSSTWQGVLRTKVGCDNPKLIIPGSWQSW
jgi:hypothetical protein